MYIQAFIIVLLVGKLMKKIFFGQLRANEFEVSLLYFYLFQIAYRIPDTIIQTAVINYKLYYYAPPR